jgi:hypothetical protein
VRFKFAVRLQLLQVGIASRTQGLRRLRIVRHCGSHWPLCEINFDEGRRAVQITMAGFAVGVAVGCTITGRSFLAAPEEQQQILQMVI